MTDGSDDSTGSPDSEDSNVTHDAGYDEWLDALAGGEGYALRCSEGHGSLPPRRVCPECGSTDLSRASLPDTGTVETFSVVHVPSPRFAEDAPYVTAIVDVGPTRLTGVLRGVDIDGDDVTRDDNDVTRDDPDDGSESADDVGIGTTVAIGVEERTTDGEPLVVFRPVESE